ncbi:hypothetical protein CDAR_453411 [Caerostris darwini]|uniref:Uncharacterized protein n=1 Tax=Caerostris darwini TaxID=1538125 RepID=A0AAV4Q899_9ARAC|nr:hypothetical protein CDAR_453411 [Caerostris darwini]
MAPYYGKSDSYSFLVPIPSDAAVNKNLGRKSLSVGNNKYREKGRRKKMTRKDKNSCIFSKKERLWKSLSVGNNKYREKGLRKKITRKDNNFEGFSKNGRLW